LAERHAPGNAGEASHSNDASGAEKDTDKSKGQAVIKPGATGRGKPARHPRLLPEAFDERLFFWNRFEKD
jgi:hypothetical protein